jgi:hypothetical protein
MDITTIKVIGGSPCINRRNNVAAITDFINSTVIRRFFLSRLSANHPPTGEINTLGM